jgi:hypothetical protein
MNIARKYGIAITIKIQKGTEKTSTRACYFVPSGTSFLGVFRVSYCLYLAEPEVAS